MPLVSNAKIWAPIRRLFVCTHGTDFNFPAYKTCTKSHGMFIFTQDSRISVNNHTMHLNRKKTNDKESGSSSQQTIQLERLRVTLPNVVFTPTTSAQPVRFGALFVCESLLEETRRYRRIVETCGRVDSGSTCATIASGQQYRSVLGERA